MTTEQPHDDRPFYEGFTVTDAGSANWVVRKIVEARAYGRRVRAWADAELQRAQREERRLLERFGAQLEQFAREQIELQHDGRKSIALPSGTIGFRVEPTRLTIADEQELIRWCRVHLPSALRTMQGAVRAPLNDYLKKTGECPKGAEIVGGAERFYISEKYKDFVEGAEDGAAE